MWRLHKHGDGGGKRLRLYAAPLSRTRAAVLHLPPACDAVTQLNDKAEQNRWDDINTTRRVNNSNMKHILCIAPCSNKSVLRVQKSM